MVGRIHRFAIGVAGGLRDPGPMAGAQNRLERGHQAAGRHRAFDSRSPMEVLIRFAIRNRKQPAVAQFVDHRNAQPLGGPLRFSGIAQPRLLLSGSSRGVQTGGELGHLPLQRLERFSGRKIGPGRRGSSAHVAQPFRQPCQRTAQRRLQNQQRDAYDQRRLHHQPRQRMPPQRGLARFDIRRVLKNGDRPEQGSSGHNRQLIRIQQSPLRVEELSRPAT